jgi:undecaprenyl-diphosphatase
MARTGTLHSLSLLCTRHITAREALLMQWLAELRYFPWLTSFFVLVSRLGDGSLWGATAAGFLVFGGPQTRWAVAAAALAITVSVRLFMAVKNMIGRPRPFVTWQNLRCLLQPPDRFSFPSGHTMTAFAAATVYALLIPGAALFFLPLATLIGLSRIFLGCHYPTDVLVGALLGSTIGFVTVNCIRLPL